MSCGKRHGTTILFTQGDVATYDDCMEMCGKVVACHSVDYQQRTGKCYMGSAHSGPSIAAPGFQSATSMGCKGACDSKCCGK